MASPWNRVDRAIGPQNLGPNHHQIGPDCSSHYHIQCGIKRSIAIPRGTMMGHKQRNRRAPQPRPPRIKTKNKRDDQSVKLLGIFPNDVAVPPHRGANVHSITYPLPTAPSTFGLSSAVVRVVAPSLSASLNALASPVPAQCADPRTKALKVRKRKSAKSKARPRAVKPVPAKPVTPRPAELAPVAAESSAIRLPPQPEPLVRHNHALAIYREPGLLGQLGDWLGRRAVIMWRQIGGIAPMRPEHKMRRLQAENAKLKAQLQAMLAQQQAHPQPVSPRRVGDCRTALPLIPACPGGGLGVSPPSLQGRRR